MDSTNLWHPEDWDGEIPADIWDRVLAMQGDGEADVVVVLVSPAFEGGRTLLADLGRPDIEAGALTPLVAVPGHFLMELLDRRLGAGVGGIVMGVRLTDPDAIRGVLVLPETIEIHALSPEPGAENVWSLCILDLASKRLPVSGDSGLSWRSSNLSL
jgi:hypothetical protein